MPIYLVGAVPIADNQVRIVFSEAVNQNAVMYAPSNYAFDIRYGLRKVVYSKQIAVDTASSVIVTLTDTLLQGGHYQVLVTGVSAISDNIPIGSGPGPTKILFEAGTYGAPAPTFSIRDRMPTWYNTFYGSNLFGILGATGQALAGLVDDTTVASQSQAKAEVVIRTASGVYLDTVANNYGANRPATLRADDDLWRTIAPYYIMGRRPILAVFVDMLQALKDSYGGDFRVWTVKFGTLVIEMTPDFPLSGATSGPSQATYLHKDASVIGIPTPPGGYPGDYIVADKTIDGSTVRMNIVIVASSDVYKNLFDPLRAAGITVKIEVKEM